MTVSLNTAIKPGPAAVQAGQDPEQRREIEASGETYEQAREALMEQVPTGWFVIGVKRW